MKQKKDTTTPKPHHIIKDVAILKSNYTPLAPHELKSQKTDKSSPNWTNSQRFQAKTKETQAIIFGILGILTNVLGFFFGFLALKNNLEAKKMGSKTKTGIILGLSSIITASLSLGIFINLWLPAPSNTVTEEITEQIQAPYGFTEPGTHLAFGQSATLPYAPNALAGAKIDLSVKEIVLAPEEEISRLDIQEQIGQQQAYYVKYDIKNISEQDLEFINIDNNLRAVLSNGAYAQAITIKGNFSPCPPLRVSPELNLGQPVNACRIFLAPKNDKLESIKWQENEGEYSEPLNRITWESHLKQL